MRPGWFTIDEGLDQEEHSRASQSNEVTALRCQRSDGVEISSNATDEARYSASQRNQMEALLSVIDQLQTRVRHIADFRVSAQAPDMLAVDQEVDQGQRLHASQGYELITDAGRVA